MGNGFIYRISHYGLVLDYAYGEVKVMGIALKVAANSGPVIRVKTRKPPTHTPENPWEKYQLKLLPKRINGKWYKPGSWVYRRWVLTPGGGYYKYGDDFDFMRGR